jgi:hypothetical protein
MSRARNNRVVTMKWTEEALDSFIALFNSNSIFSDSGDLIKISKKDYGHYDEVSLLFYIEKPEIHTLSY